MQEKTQQITLRVSENTYAKWKRLGKDWKRFIRDFLEVLVESAGERLKPPALQIHTNIQLDPEARELLEKLKKAEQAILCVTKTLQVYRDLCEKTCVENIKKCTKRYWG